MITWKVFSPANRDPGITYYIKGARPVWIKELGPSVKHTKSGVNASSSLNFASEQNGSSEGRNFPFYVTHKGLPDHKTT